MFTLARNKANRPGSKIALAIALACGTALGATVLEAPASAQKRGKSPYSKEFIAAYTTANTILGSEAPDFTALRAALPGVEAAIVNEDDKMAAGRLFYSAGVKMDDTPLKRRGFALMIESNRVPPESLADYNFNAGGLAYNDSDYEAARGYFQSALDLGHQGPNLPAVIAESYFRQDRYAEGLSHLRQVINAKSASGQTIDEEWIKRGMTVAYSENIGQEAIRFSIMWADHFPSPTSWHDAVAIQRGFVDYDNNATLDLLRLARRVGGLINNRSYSDYVEVADARRLPVEVKAIIEEGVAAGHVDMADLFISDAMETAKSRIAADRADLASLEAEGRSATSSAVNTTSAGDVFLNFDNPAKAEELYRIALTKDGVDQPRVLTRLGIALSDQGKWQEAADTFAQIKGVRLPIAMAWSVYVDQQMEEATASEAPVEAN